MKYINPNTLYSNAIGVKVGSGECGALTSDYILHMSNGKYQWAGEPNTNGQLPPNCNPNSAWDVYTSTNWGAIGIEYINNPSLSQIKVGDIFYVSPRPNLPTGHTGIVVAVSNSGVTTIEQNVNGVRRIQRLTHGNNSFTWYGFQGITRVKQTTPPTPQKGEIDMFIIKTVPHGKYKDEAYFITDGVSIRHIGTTRMLEAYRKMGVKEHQMWRTELDEEFKGSIVIYKK